MHNRPPTQSELTTDDLAKVESPEEMNAEGRLPESDLAEDKLPEGNLSESMLPRPPKPDPTWRVKLRLAYEHIRRLQGDPHYVAMGMAIGVFVAVTPTIPFHTIIAIALAFVLRGSKPAAAIGVWVSNPVTIPFFYYGSYKIGALLMRMDLPAEIPYESITDMLDLGADVTLAMMLGGCVLGILPAIVAYMLTLRLVRRLRRRAAVKPS